MFRILIAPDSFKECCNSLAISGLIMKNLAGLKGARLRLKPVSDGGDGFLEVCKFHFGGRIKNYVVSTPYDDSKFTSPVLYNKKSKLICIETAKVLGLNLIPMKFRHPLELSSKGLGDLLLQISKDISEKHLLVEKIYIGIGGTATIDMGLGMMSRLGLKLLDDHGNELTVLPRNFKKSREIEFGKFNPPFKIIVVTDVMNPLIGKEGGIRVYGKQKGASVKELSEIEGGFNNIINLLKNKELIKTSEFLSGAGGGIPVAFRLFFNSYIKSSYEFILSDLKLRNKFQNIDYLITGEGKFDLQSLYGKGAGLLTAYYSNRVKKVFLLCGEISPDVKNMLPENAVGIELCKYFSNKSESLKKYKKGIRLACSEIKEYLKF